jgi:hypothetical protein
MHQAASVGAIPGFPQSVQRRWKRSWWQCSSTRRGAQLWRGLDACTSHRDIWSRARHELLLARRHRTPEQFRKTATTPTDPEVVYVEEASALLSDGRGLRVVMAGSRAAIRRFTAAAKKLGMEVRFRGKQ